MRNKYTIIMLGMSSQADWDQGILNKKLQKVQTGAVNRNYHILQHLLKSPEVARVIHVDFLPFTSRKKIKEVIQAKLWKSTAKTVKRGFTWRIDAQSDKHWSMATVRWQDVQHLNQFILPHTDLVVWSYHPFFPQIFDFFPTAKKVFDTVDNWAEHPVYTHIKEHLETNYNIIEKKADIIFTVSPDLTKLFAKHPKVFWIPNGVDVDHFTHPSSSSVQEFPQPFVVYVGVIQERLDAELLAQAARLSPQITFILAGPVWEGTPLADLPKLPNVHFIGPVAYQDLPGLLHRAVAGIIPHRVNRFTSSMNPLKLYEYLASGLPVISTPVKGTEQFPAGVTRVSTPQEFTQAIQQALKLTTQEKQQLVELVRDHTWEKRVQLMLSYL